MLQNDKRHATCGTRIVRFKNDPPVPKASIFCDEIKNDILHKTGKRFPGTFEEILASARKKQANRNRSKVSFKYGRASSNTNTRTCSSTNALSPISEVSATDRKDFNVWVPCADVTGDIKTWYRHTYD